MLSGPCPIVLTLSDISSSLELELTSNQPVNFVWLERKVMEWGCMQALIDFDGWRKWKDFSANQANANEEKEKKTLAKKKKNRVSVGSSGSLGSGNSANRPAQGIDEMVDDATPKA